VKRVIFGPDFRVGQQPSLKLLEWNGHVTFFARRSASSIAGARRFLRLPGRHMGLLAFEVAVLTEDGPGDLGELELPAVPDLGRRLATRTVRSGASPRRRITNRSCDALPARSPSPPRLHLSCRSLTAVGVGSTTGTESRRRRRSAAAAKVPPPTMTASAPS
jgi:hypothetical protein